MRYRMFVAICLVMRLVLVDASEPGGPPPPDKPPPPAKPLPVSLPVLIDAAQAALAACRASGWPVGLTVVDADLSVRLSLRDPGAGAGSVEVSHRKAYTAAKTGMSSDDYARTLAEDDIVYPSATPGSTRRGEPSVRNGDPMLLPRAGGLPIVVDGKVVGAMGVSGRPAGGDVDCVKAGLAKIAASVK